MPRAQALYPDLHTLGQCEAQREGRYAPGWEAQHPDKRCVHSAKYAIDDKKLCSRHAGVAALRILLTEETP